MSNEQDKTIFGNEMKSTATEQTHEQPVHVFTPDEIAARFGGKDPLLDEINALHKGLPAYRHDLIDQHIRENAKPKGQMLDNEEGTGKMTDAKKDELTVNDRLDVLEFRHKSMVNPPATDWLLYSGAQRENNDQPVREIQMKHDTARHAILDELGIPKTRADCTSEELERIDDPNKKQRNASLSGSHLGMLDKLTVRQRIELGMTFYGQYMLSLSEPSRVVYDEKMYEVMYRGWLGDVQAACDNVRVPRYLDECTEEERAHLERLMAQREAEDREKTRRAEQVGGEIAPGTMDRFKELVAKHPFKMLVPVSTPRIGPRGHLSDPDPWPFQDYQSDPAKMPLLTDYVFDVGRKHLEDGPQVPVVTTTKSRDRDRYPRHDLFIDPMIVAARQQHKTLFTEYHLHNWVSHKTWYSKLHHSDSIDMFTRKMNDRPRCGRSAGYWAVHLAWVARADILGEVRVFARDAFKFQEVTYYAHNGRQIGKSHLWETLFYARHTNWGNRNWPRTKQMGFFLHGAYPLIDSCQDGYPSHNQQPWGYLDKLIMADLFPNHQEIDYGRTSCTPRHPRTGKRHGR